LKQWRSGGIFFNTPMPWSCPACATHINTALNETMPRAGAVYRCHVCRLELVLDAATGKMKIAPMEDSPFDGRRRKPDQESGSI